MISIYKFIVFKQFNPIPAIFNFKWDEGNGSLMEEIEGRLSQNSFIIKDMKGNYRIYDRSIITKIIIKKVGKCISFY